MDKENGEEGDGEDAPAVLTPAKVAKATNPVNQDYERSPPKDHPVQISGVQSLKAQKSQVTVS